MRLLFDQNLSRHLADRLADVFPDSLHVSSLGLSSATDLEVWETARDQGLALITKDADFNELQILQGFPPYVDLDSEGELHDRRDRGSPQAEEH